LIIFSGIFSEGTSNLCLDGVRWEALPAQFDFDAAGLTFRVTGGQASSGRVHFKRDPTKAGIIELSLAAYPAKLIQDPELSYSLGRTRDGMTTLEIHLPSTSHGCMKLDAVIYLPADNLEYLQLDTKNMAYETESATLNVSHLVLQSSNNRIQFHSKWQGKTLLFETTNALIQVTQPIESDDKVTLSTKNGNIEISDVIKAKNAIVLSTTNAGIDAAKNLETASLTCSTSNGHVSLNQVKAGRAHVRASNGYLQLNHGDITDMIDTQTSNGKLDVHLDECASCGVIASTTNANLRLGLVRFFLFIFSRRFTYTRIH
jgi:hypothetical protein